MNKRVQRRVDTTMFHTDVAALETAWRKIAIGTSEIPLIDQGQGSPVVFVPFLEHFEFVYAHQFQTLSQRRRAILYRRRELRTREIGRDERVEELRLLFDGLGLTQADLVGHASGGIVALEFALRYPHRCRSLTLLAQGADYYPALYTLTQLLQEFYMRLPLEEVLPSGILRQLVLNAQTGYSWENRHALAIPRHLLEEQLCKIYQWPLVFKYSVLPLLWRFDVRRQIPHLHIPILLINRADDPLTPEAQTRWLAQHSPHCAGYHIVPGREHFFPYAQAELVTPLIEAFLATRDKIDRPLKQLY